VSVSLKEPYKDGFVLRYFEKSPQQALLQKYARLVSGLYALELRLRNGFVQEPGVIQRTLDDITEDILFITLGLSTGKWTEHQTKFLEYFWAGNLVREKSTQGMVQRKTIRAYNNRISGLVAPSKADANGREIYKTMSGYVHAASVNITDMCVGNPATLPFSRYAQKSPLPRSCGGRMELLLSRVSEFLGHGKSV
jgi:hypothetical protein